MLGAAGLRLLDLRDPPLDFHPTRQLHSAEIARGMYFAGQPAAPDWQREMAAEQWANKGLIEPQILEAVTAWSYDLLGGEHLWVPRLLSILAWCLGGVAVHAAGRLLVGRWAGMLAAAYFLFAPFAVLASRAFMPDPLMVALCAGALWAALRWRRTQATPPDPTADSGMRWAVIAGLLTGAAILVKAVAALMLGPFWVALVLGLHGRAAVRSRQVWVIGVLSVAMAGLYFVYGIFVSGALRQQFSRRFFPELWNDPGFYMRWGQMVDRVIEWPWLLIAALGLATLRDRVARRALVAWAAGYVGLGLALSHHTSTHDYYTLPLLPVIAVGIGAAGASVFRLAAPGRGPVTAALAAVLAALAVTGAGSAYRLLATDYRPQVARWEGIARAFAPEDRVVGLVADYGHPFRFFGWRNYVWWPATYDWALMDTTDFAGYWRERTEGMDYFLVTEFHELSAQPDVQAHLSSNCTLVIQEADHWVYDLSAEACRSPR